MCSPTAAPQANFAVFLAVLNPGDTILAMDLSHGGHLTHGSPVNCLRANGSGLCITAWIQIRSALTLPPFADWPLECKPQLIICGFSAYPRIIDFAAFRAIADEVGAYLLADMAHIAGLVAAEVHPQPTATLPCGNHHHPQNP